MANQAGWQKYVMFKKESSWGSTPGAGDIMLPVSTWDVSAVPVIAASDTFTGVRQAVHHEVVGYDVAGSLACPVFGWQDSGNTSILEYLLDMALAAPAGLDLDSVQFDVYDVSDPKRYLGCRCNSLTLTGSADQQILSLSMDIIGKTETTTATGALVATDMPARTPALFKDITANIGGAVTPSLFSLTVSNNLDAARLTGAEITSLAAGSRSVTLTIAIQKSANTWDVKRRTVGEQNVTGQLVLKAIHDGTGATGAYTTATIDFDRAAFQEATDDDGDRNRLIVTTTNHMALKPLTTSNEIDIAYGESA